MNGFCDNIIASSLRNLAILPLSHPSPDTRTHATYAQFVTHHRHPRPHPILSEDSVQRIWRHPPAIASKRTSIPPPRAPPSIFAMWHHYPKKMKKRGDLPNAFGSSSGVAASVPTIVMFVPLGSTTTRRTRIRSYLSGGICTCDSRDGASSFRLKFTSNWLFFLTTRPQFQRRNSRCIYQWENIPNPPHLLMGALMCRTRICRLRYPALKCFRWFLSPQNRFLDGFVQVNHL